MNMILKIKKIGLLFLLWNFTQIAYAQQPINHWDATKIKGARFLPYSSYNGFPFLTEDWCLGKIELTNGEIADSLSLKYSSYKDELIYYNRKIWTMINIDKASINRFTIADSDGHTRTFIKQYFDNYEKSYRFFEILSGGETSLLAYRRVILDTTSPYHDNNGNLKNMAYDPRYQFYFYAPEKGYTSVRLNLASLLSKFDKTLQKPIKRLLRKNKIRIQDEYSFIQAWKTIEKEGCKVIF
jgi:hypothetical protein